MKFLPLIWSGVWRKPGRAVLALLQIMVAFALFGLLFGFSDSIKQSIAATDADLMLVHSRGGMANLPVADYERIKQVPGVKIVNYADYFNASYQKPSQQMLVIATLPRNWATITTDIIIAPAAVEKLESTRTGAIVGGTLIRKYGWKIGQRIPLQTPVQRQDGSTNWAFDIVGVLEMKDPLKRAEHSTIVIINYSYYDEARVAGNGTVQQLILRVDDPQQGAVVADNIDKLFANSPNETRTESLREMSQSQMQSIGDLDFIVHSVSAAVLFSLLFSVGSTMMQSTRERTAELAVLKTLGFSDRLVIALLVSEALLLCLTSAALGLGLAALLLWVATRMGLVSTHLLLPTTGLIIGAAWAVALALVSSTLPAWRSLQLRVVTALGVR